MRRAIAVGTFAAVVFLFLAGSTLRFSQMRESTPPVTSLDGVPAETPGDEPATLEISIKPSREGTIQLLGKRQTPTSYAAAVSVLDTTGKKIFGGASVYVEPGTRETASGKLRDGEVTLTVALNREASHALAEVVVMRNGVVVQRQKSDVLLRVMPPQGNVPLR